MIRPVTILLTWSLAQSALAAPPTSGRGGSPPPRDGATKQDETVAKAARKPPRGLAFKALRTEIENATFKDMTFEEFAEWIERATKANVVVRWNVLEEAGIERDALVNLKLRNVTVRKLLQLAFAQVAGATEGVELAYRADDNTLTISTKRDLNNQMLTRIYDVQALLIIVPNFSGPGVGDPTSGRTQGGGRTPGSGISAGGGRGSGGGGGSGRSGRGGGSGEGRSDTIEQKAEKLIQMITSSIDPESWAVNGGKGTITYYKGSLVVRNHLGVHERLGGAPPPQPRAPQKTDPKEPAS